jgi:GNAT superfamily N-acetyltransferase
MLIREATPKDSNAVCDVVRRSITDLCLLDHRGDAETLDAWLSNKRPEMFATWSLSPRHVSLLAEVDAVPAAYGLLERSGTVALLYVAPEARFKGASRALLAEMERRAVQLGLTRLSLESSATAREFYERNGFISAAAPQPGFGRTTCYPMTKQLIRNAGIGS